MSVLNQSGEEQVECPLCMEPLEVDDLHFYPCTCGYQICRFCWNRIREGENGLCPACRKPYPENPADFTPLSQEQVAAIKTEKKAREQKRRNKTLESRKALANVRVVQNNLVFVVGLPVRLADPEILKRQEYFGKYGKIHKVVINQSTTYAGTQQGPSASAYVTYVSSADALRAIQGVNNATLDGRVLKGSLGTTKYCANFMKNQPCPKPDCMYLHELGDPKASFTKEEMHAGLHQVYERKLHNQLLAMTREASNNGSGNSSTSAEKSTKDGNPSNFIPTTVVTSSHINDVVSSAKSNNKKDPINGVNIPTSSGSSSSASSGSGKDAWPSLGSSPRDSPKHTASECTDKSNDNESSDSSSPTLPEQQQQQQQQHQQQQQQQQQATKNKDRDDKHRRDTQPNKRSKSDKKKSNSITSNEEPEPIPQEIPAVEENHEDTYDHQNQSHSVFNKDQYLTHELDELESERHNLLENHDLLNSSDHSLLEDDSTHNLLSESNNEALIMARHREMLAGLVDNQNHMMPKGMNGYYNRDMSYERHMMNMNNSQKEMLLRERSRSEMLMRNEMLARNAMAEPKHYMPQSSIGLESASELLGANFHQNPNILPPFGMRVDNSMSNTIPNSLMNNTMSNVNNMNMNSQMGLNSLNNMSGVNNMSGLNSMSGVNGLNTGINGYNTMDINGLNNMGVNNLGVNNMGVNNMNNLNNYMMHNQQVMNQQMNNPGLVNGFDHTSQNSEGRYLAENMDKFFTDFHKAQQMRQMLGSHRTSQPQYPVNHHNLDQHKQRMSGRGGEGATAPSRCAGDGDDDLDFDPFKETQKALAEMMETEMMQTSVSSGDNMQRVRSHMAPPGFTSPHARMPPSLHQAHGYTSNNPIYADWTQMDPAIVSTSASAKQNPVLSPQQQEIFARFNQLNVNGQYKQQQQNWGSKMPWTAPYSAIPLPPGFAPQKPSNRPAECIDAK